MSSLVTAEGGRRAPRVVPKVFADVPSASELAAVRKNRNTLAVWVVLLFGMLAATVAAFVLVIVFPELRNSGSDVRDQWAARGSTLDDQRAEVDAAIIALNDTRQIVDPQSQPFATKDLATDSTDVVPIADLVKGLNPRIQAMYERNRELETQYGSYNHLRDLEARAREIDSTVSALLADDSRTGARSQASLEDDFQVLDNKAPLNWKDAQANALESYINSLVNACNAIRNFDSRVDPLGRPLPPRANNGPACSS